ncbi:MAG: MotA/TolQ/ExbB proton channel family protein [Alphaproteobacteria bacterium]|nr:MotA/TolQ/ExbB proton channel family protein [Alphaproteobacteria bacterium]
MQYRYLLISRYALINVVAAALSIAAYLQGWLDGVFQAHLRELSGLIFLVFLYGLALCGAKIWRHGNDLNDLDAGAPDPRSQSGQYLVRARAGDGEGRGIQAQALRLKLTDRIVVVRQIADSLIFLGLIGTVIGFIVALSGVDPSAADQVENVSAMVATLISGMSVALNTTLVGAVLYVWLIINYRILVSGTVDLIAATLELGEADAGP